MARSALNQVFQKIIIELNWMRNDINDYGYASHKGWQKPSKLYYQFKFWWMTHIWNNMILNCGDHSNGREDDEWWFILARVDCWLCIMMGKWWWVMMITSSILARVDHGSWIMIQTGWWWMMIYSCSSGSYGIFLMIFLMIFLIRNDDYSIYSCSSWLLGIFLLFSEYLHLTKDALCWITTQSKFLIFLCFDIGLFRIPLLALYFLIILIDTFDAIQCMAMLDMFTFRAAYNVWFFIKFPSMPRLQDVWKFSSIIQSCRIAHITKGEVH